MNSSGNAVAEKQVNSELLQHLLDLKKVPLDIAQWADQYPTPELQSEAIHLLRDDQAQSKTRVEVVMREKMAADGDPEDQGAEASGTHLHMPTGRVGKAVKSIEKVAAWDMVGDLEEWMAVKVPPYRAARRVFSWLWMAFGAEAMLATLISCVLLYGAFLGIRWTYHRITQGPAPSVQGPVTKSGNQLGAGNLALGPAVTVPQIIEQTYVVGHKLRLRWSSMGPGYTYLIYRSYPGSQEPARALNGDQPLHALGAMIDIDPVGDKDTWLSVTAVDGNGHESKPSEPVHFEFSAMNQNNTVVPIAEEPTQNPSLTLPRSLEGRGQGRPQGETRVRDAVGKRKPQVARNDSENASTNQSKPSFVSSLTKHLLNNADSVISSAIPIPVVGQGLIAAKNAAVTASEENPPTPPLSKGDQGGFAVPAVVNLRGERVGNTIRMTWDAPGTNYRYNVYVAYDNPHPVFDTGSDAPLSGPVITWTPPSDGIQVFVLYIKAVDAQGHEGPPSNRIVADLR